VKSRNRKVWHGAENLQQAAGSGNICLDLPDPVQAFNSLFSQFFFERFD